MPTRYPRVPVTVDEPLGRALARVEEVRGATVQRARLLRELALRGAEVVLEEERGRREALERLADVSTSADPPFDRAVLARVRDEAWRHGE